MGFLNVGSVIASWLVITTGFCVYFLPESQQNNRWIISLLFFNNLNLFIALCEIVLGYHIKTIQSDYTALRSKYKGNEWDACVAFLTMPLTISQCFSGRIWSKMWSTYALYDPSYQNHESFGFFIDVGNGYSTIVPSILMNAAMVFPSYFSSLWVGCICLASYWQIMYGTIIYSFSFLFNKRYQGKGLLEISLFVGVSNGMWFVFPIIGIWYCVLILRDGDMDIFM